MPIRKSWDKLSRLNAHDRDKLITFREEGHKYLINGIEDEWQSVTSILSKLHSSFEPIKAANSLIRGKRYQDGSHPLSGKSIEEIVQFWENENKKGTAFHARMEYEMNYKVARKINHVNDSFKEIMFDGQPLRMNTANGEVFEYFENGDTEIQEISIGYQWKDGTIRRNHVNDSELGEDEPILSYEEAIAESKQRLQFWKEHSHLKPYRSEWIVWDQDHLIAGTIDAVFKDTTTGEYWIYDWKRVSSGLEIDLEATRYGYVPDDNEWLQEIKPWTVKMKSPMEELYDTKYWNYSLQLNLYKSILERHYGIKIAGMALIQFHPGNRRYYKHIVVNLEKQIQTILSTLGRKPSV